MTIRFVPAALAEIRDDLQRHWTSQPSAGDSFLEDHIMASAHVQILVDDQVAGFTSIHNGNLITQFVLETPFKQAAQGIYRDIKRLAEVQAAFVPTCDEFFLSHALDEYRLLTKQAYFFAIPPEAVPSTPPERYTLRLAQLGDIAMIQEGSGDFFRDIKKYIGKQELFLTFAEETCVGFGIMKRSELGGHVASIGMFVIQRFRRQGAGTATLRLLQNECHRQSLRPIAGCWYYNHLSKKTLERAGMFSQTRLLRIEY